MTYDIRTMTIEDYDDVISLWNRTPGLSISDDDSRQRIYIYLTRNPELSFVAFSDGELIATVMCGHDGRRGILRHLAVDERYRGRGLARDLVERSVAALAKQEITKCNLYVLDSNPSAKSFWEYLGWYHLEDNYRTLQAMTRA
jgi:ribosomal protein S18 acetylase RimI-like enzyme